MATVTQSEFDLAYIRRSQEDHKRIMDALKADGTLTIEPDAAPEEPPPLLDENGEPVVDSEGNPVLEAPQAYRSTDLQVAIDNMPEEGEPVIPEDIVVEVAPGTQNAAAPFPENFEKKGRGRARKSEGD